MRIAIIGTGVAGISVLRELVKQQRPRTNLEILLFDEEPTFGTGLPYQPDDSVFLLNQTPETMSIDPDDSNHFVEWAKSYTEYSEPEGKHLPREVYGMYLRDVLRELIKKSGAQVIKEKVDAIRMESDGRPAVFYGKEKQIVDVVHLCTGHLPFKDPYHLRSDDRYFHQPYPAAKNLKDLPPASTVGILGTGLTAIDLVLYLHEQKKDVSVCLTSLDGTFGAVKGKGEPVQLIHFTKERILHAKSKHGGNIPLTTVVEWFKKEARLHEVDVVEMWSNYGEGTIQGLKQDLKNLTAIGRFQSMIHQLDDCLPELWLSLTQQDKQIFLKKYGRKWNKFRSPVPQQTALKLIRFYEEGFIEAVEPTKTIRKSGAGFLIESESGKTRDVDYLINASGQNLSLENVASDMPLVNQLLEEQLLRPEEMGGIQVTWPELRAIGGREEVLPQLIVHGQLIAGVQFGNNTMGMISSSAVRAVERMFHWLEEAKKL